MPNTVDTRIVEMQFDNAQFESGIHESMRSLENLEKTFDNFDDDSFDNVATSIGSCSAGFAEMAANAEMTFAQIARFTVLGTSIASVTNQIQNSVERFLKALTIDPLTTGFDEYNTYIDSFQTIMAGTRKEFGLAEGGLTEKLKEDRTAEQVEVISNALDELNRYADKTIYNFTQMTANIGKFTAAGVKLDTAVSAIEGISNLAAMSGADSAANNRAMYNISQALQSGKMLTRDWMSLENAGMATKEFQDLLLEIAKKQGQKVDISKGFRESLSDGWLTNDVLLDALNIYGGAWDNVKAIMDHFGVDENQAQYFLELGEAASEAATQVKTIPQLLDTLKEAAQSGWTRSWTIIIGDLSEAKETLTAVSKWVGEILDKNSEKRNKTLEEWKSLGGRSNLFNGIGNIAVSLKNIFDSISTAMTSVRSGLTGAKLAKVSEQFYKLSQSFRSFTENEKVVRVFHQIGMVLGNIVNIGFDRISYYFGIIKRVFSALAPLGTTFSIIFTQVVRVVNAFTSALSKSRKPITIFDGLLQSISDAITWMNTKLEKAAKWIGDTLYDALFAYARGGLVAAVKSIFSDIGLLIWNVVADSLSDEGKTVFANLRKDKGVWGSIVSAFASMGGDIVRGLWKGIKEKFASLRAKVTEIFWNVVTWVKKLFGIESPSKVFAEIGWYIMEGLERGLRKGITIAKDIFGIVLSTALKVLLGLAAGAVTIGMNLFVGIKDGIEEAYEKGGIKGAILKVGAMIFDAIKNIWWMYKDVHWSLLEGAVGIGVYIFESLIEGIDRVFPGVKDYVYKIFGDFIDFVKHIFGIASPSKVFKEIGEFIVIGFMNGLAMFKNAWKSVQGYLQPVVDWVKNAASVVWNALKNFFSGGGEQKAENEKNIFQAIGSALKTGWEFLKNAATTVATEITAFLKSDLFKTIVDLWKSFVIARAARNAGKGIKNVGDGMKGISKALNNLSKGFTFGKPSEIKKIDSIGTTFLKIAASIGIMVGVIYVLTKISWQTVLEGVAKIATIMGIMIAIGFLARKISGREFLSLAGAVAVLMIPMYILSKMSWDTVLNGVGKLALIMLAMNLAAKNSPGKGFIGFAVAVGVMTLALKSISKLSWEGVFKGAAGLMAIALAMRIASKNMNAKGLIGMALSLGIMALTLKAIARMDFWSLVQGLGGLFVIVLMFKSMVKSAAGFNATGLITMVAAVAILAYTAARLGDIPIGKLVKGVAAVGVLGLIIKSMIKGVNLKSVGSGLLGAVGVLIVFAGAMVVFGVAMKTIMSMTNDTEKMRQIAESFSMMFGTVGLITALVGKLGLGAAVKGVLGIVVIFGALGTIGYFLADWLKDNEDLKSNLAMAGRIFESVGNAVGRLIGGLIGGLAAGLTSGLPEIAENLSSFSEKILPFTQNVKQIDGGVLVGVGYMCGMLLAIIGTEFIDSITSFFGLRDTFGNFAKHVGSVMGTLTQFAKDSIAFGKVYGDGKDFDNAVNCAKALADMLDAIPGGSLWDKLGIGISDSELMAKDIANVFGALDAFATTAKDFKMTDYADMKDIVKVTEDLTTLLEKVPEYSLFEKIKGLGVATDTEMFASDITALIEGIKAFGDKIPELATAMDTAGTAMGSDTWDISKITTLVSELQELVKAMPEYAWYETLSGKTPTKTFANDLNALINGLSVFGTKIPFLTMAMDFATSTSKDGSWDIEKIKQFVLDLIGVVDAMPDYAWWEKLLWGDTDTEAFAKDLGALGDGLMNFANAVKDAFPENNQLETQTDQAMALINQVKGYMDEMDESEGVIDKIVEWFKGEGNSWGKLKDIGKSLATFGTGFGDFATSIQLAQNATESFSLITELINSIHNWIDDTSMTTVMEEIDSDFEDFAYLFAKMGSAVSSFFEGKQMKDGTWEWGLDLNLQEETDQLRSVADILQSISDIMQYTGLISEPTITPVVDMTNVEEASEQINAMFGYGLSPVPMMSARRNLSNLSMMQETNSNADIIAEMRVIEARIDTLSENVGNMQMVLDTGTLVGSITTQVDRRLGRMAAYRARGG